MPRKGKAIVLEHNGFHRAEQARNIRKDLGDHLDQILLAAILAAVTKLHAPPIV